MKVQVFAHLGFMRGYLEGLFQCPTRTVEPWTPRNQWPTSQQRPKSVIPNLYPHLVISSLSRFCPRFDLCDRIGSTRTNLHHFTILYMETKDNFTYQTWWKFWVICLETCQPQFKDGLGSGFLLPKTKNTSVFVWICFKYCKLLRIPSVILPFRTLKFHWVLRILMTEMFFLFRRWCRWLYINPKDPFVCPKKGIIRRLTCNPTLGRGLGS